MAKKPDTELRDYWNSEPDDDPSTAKTVTYVPKVVNSADDKISERIAEYERDFDVTSLTVADRSQIKNLARLEVAIESLTEKLSTIGTSDPKEAKSLSDTLSSLMTQHRQLSNALGIDRKSRADRGQGEYEEYLPRLHRETERFLAERSIIIMCPHCMAEKAKTKINEGLIIFHFREDVRFLWQSECPRCKKEFTINQDNWKQFTRAEIDNTGRMDSVDEPTEEEPD